MMLIPRLNPSSVHSVSPIVVREQLDQGSNAELDVKEYFKYAVSHKTKEQVQVLVRQLTSQGLPQQLIILLVGINRITNPTEVALISNSIGYKLPLTQAQKIAKILR